MKNVIITRLVFLSYILLYLKVAADFSKADFNETRRSKYFIDKTMMIKDFLNYSQTSTNVLVVTAPPRTGKSTILDMFKRFLAIEVDESGTKVPPHENKNYKLFCDPPLNICQNKSFVDDHFGQYPVLHVDFSPLKDLFDYNTFVHSMHIVIQHAFSQHIYLLQQKDIWHELKKIVTADEFKLYLKYAVQSENKIVLAFIYLLRVMFEFYYKNIIILVDNYDTVFNAMFSVHRRDNDKIIHLSNEINKSFLRNGVMMELALLTGVTYYTEIENRYETDTFQFFRYLLNDTFSRYYGFTSEEVCELVHKNVHNVEERQRVQEFIQEYYGNYLILGDNSNVTLHRLESVVRFFTAGRKHTDDWCLEQYLFSLFDIFDLKQVKNVLNELLFHETFNYADVSKPWTFSCIFEMTTDHENMEKFFSHIFNSGLLTTLPSNIDEIDIFSVKIPNKEMFLKVSKFLFFEYTYSNSYKTPDLNRLEKLIASFKPGKVGAKEYQHFYDAFYFLFKNSEHVPETVNELQTFIFVFLVNKFTMKGESRVDNTTDYCSLHSLYNSTIPLTLDLHKKELCNTVDRVKVRIPTKIINNHNFILCIETNIKNRYKIPKLRMNATVRKPRVRRNYTRKRKVKLRNTTRRTRRPYRKRKKLSRPKRYLMAPLLHKIVSKYKTTVRVPVLRRVALKDFKIKRNKQTLEEHARKAFAQVYLQDIVIENRKIKSKVTKHSLYIGISFDILTKAISICFYNPSTDNKPIVISDVKKNYELFVHN